MLYDPKSPFKEPLQEPFKGNLGLSLGSWAPAACLEGLSWLALGEPRAGSCPTHWLLTWTQTRHDPIYHKLPREISLEWYSAYIYICTYMYCTWRYRGSPGFPASAEAGRLHCQKHISKSPKSEPHSFCPCARAARSSHGSPVQHPAPFLQGFKYQQIQNVHGFCIMNCNYRLGYILHIWVLGPLGNE